jgi:hypothetical protein
MDVEKMHGRPVRGADEVDAFSRLHKAHRWNHGRRGYIKTGHNRRTRRVTNANLRTGRY